MALLDVKELSVHFGDEKAPFKAVDRISYQVNQGEVLGIVGESGSGKSVSSLAVMGLIDFPGRVSAKGLEFEGKDLLSLPPKKAGTSWRRYCHDFSRPDDKLKSGLYSGFPNYGSD